jgi:hypothetical protein
MKNRLTPNLTIGLVALLLSSAAGGYAQTCAPGSGPTIDVGPTGFDNATFQSTVTSAGCGATFVFSPGTYNYFSIVPLDYDQFVSSTQYGAVLSGATTVSNFVYNSKLKLYVGKIPICTTAPCPQGSLTPVASPQGSCNTGYAGCTHPEDLFFNGVLYKRVNAYTSVVSGTWFLDYTDGNVYLANNPAGNTILVSITRFAIGAGDITTVVINGFTIEYYGSPANNGAVEGVDYYHVTNIPSFNWLVENNEVQYNHGAGVWIGDQMTVTGNTVNNNGEFGIAGTGNNITVTNNEISYNNAVEYLYADGGGTKFAQVVGLNLSNNHAHDNNGVGLWTDIESSSVVISSNQTENNRVAAILHEIGYSAQIYGNTIMNDGIDTRGTGPWYGAGIMIANSSGVQVYDNTITNCQNGIIEQNKNRGKGSNGLPYQLQDVIVYDNSVTQDTGVAAGLVKNYPVDNDIYTSWGNTFGVNASGSSAPNTYTLSSNPLPFAWLLDGKANALMTLAEWEAAGNN